MKLKKSRFVLTHTQQNGILLLSGILIIIIFSQYLYNNQYNKIPLSNYEIDALAQQHIDSLKILKAQELKKPYVEKIYPFNPNYLKEGKAYRLGITAEEFDKLMAYRASGKWINSVQDFKKVTNISNDRLSAIVPYFKFPEWVVNMQKTKKDRNSQALSTPIKSNLNTASIDDLIQINGIGEKLSRRIVNYKNKIGGFRSLLQLRDVYGLNAEVIQGIESKFIVTNTNENKPIDINTASLIQLAEVPYFDYELAREIFQFIKVNEGIKSFEELSKLQQFPTSKIDRIKLYLTIIE